MASKRKFNIKETEEGIKLVLYWGNDSKVVIPNEITIIGDGAFAYHEEITEVVIPTGVKRGGMSVFYGCKSLKNLTLSRNTVFGEFAFVDCPLDIVYNYYED